jgi:hypothetical protein
MSTVAEIKEAVTQLPERKKIQFARWMQTQLPGRLEDDEMLALTTEDSQANDQRKLEAALRHSLRSPLKKYKPGHFASLTSRNSRRKIAA